jgi:hypothetical protein
LRLQPRRLEALPAQLRRRAPRREKAPERVVDLYLRHFSDPRRERLFLSSTSFFVTFGGVRALTHAIKSGKTPIGNVSEGGLHIHHLVWGILGLLGVGYAWNAQVGTGHTGSSRTGSRAAALSYGAASALTLDEFALWLNLEDDYWNSEGRESIDAIVMFGSLLSVGAVGRRFIAGVARRALEPASRVIDFHR